MGTNKPVYPNFKKIVIEDKDFFSDYDGIFPKYSDFNLLSLLSWNADDINSWCLLNDNLIIKVKDYLGEGSVVSLLGNNKIDESLKIVLADYQKLIFVPEDTVKNITNINDFLIEEDRDDFDYILSTQKMANPEGSEFRHYRQEINKFKRVFTAYEVKELDVNDSNTLEQLSNCTKLWYKLNNFNKYKQNEETSNLNSFYRYAREFNCVHLGIYINCELAVFISMEQTDPKNATGHFGTYSNSKYEGCSTIMQYEAAKYLLSKGILYHNIEQDIGLEGLRKAKLYYNPAFLKKYIVKLKY